MAEYEIISQEGTQFVKATLRDETIRAEAGALCYYQGNVTMRSPFPSIPGMVRAAFSDEGYFRPSYTGTGEVYLESSLGGYHVLDLDGDAWILESGAYWASDGGIHLTFHREKMLTSLWSGEGFIDFQTKVSGEGKVVLSADGPADEVELGDEEVCCEGKYVIARTSGVSYKIKRPTGSRMGAYTSGESMVRVYRGPGRVLLCTTPYWRLRMASQATP